MANSSSSTTIWPKQLPPLSAEQAAAREKFIQLWHEVLPNRYQGVERFNHGWVAQLPHKKGAKTLEVGAGLGAHMQFEDLSDQEYYCLELRQSFCDQLAQKMPKERVICGDIQKTIPLPDGSFDRILAIHVLEHLPDLPKALNEIKRLLRADGVLDLVLPCEGGLAYTLARKVSAERIFKKNFKMSYTPIIQNEHVSVYPEIEELLLAHFRLSQTQFFPLRIPYYAINLCVGLRLYQKSL